MTREPLRSAGLPLAVGALLGLLTGRRRSPEARSVAVPTIAAMGEAAGAGTALFDTALFDVEELEPEPPAPPRWAEVLGVFDLETTGVDPTSARIVTASVALLDEQGVVVERHDWIVDPGVEIPAGAAAVHGIDTARARRFGRAPAQVVPEILAAIATLFDRGIPLVVYNAPYDLTLLAAEAERLGLPPLPQPAPVIDPLVLDKAVDRYRKGKRTLVAAAAEYGVELSDAHDAAADAIAAGRLAQAIARRHAAELDVTAAELHERQVAWCGEQAARFQEYMRANRDPGFTTSGAWPRR